MTKHNTAAATGAIAILDVAPTCPPWCTQRHSGWEGVTRGRGGHRTHSADVAVHRTYDVTLAQDESERQGLDEANVHLAVDDSIDLTADEADELAAALVMAAARLRGQR